MTGSDAKEDHRVTVVVVTRDRRADLLETLPRHHAATVLVDNDSSDGTTAVVRDRFPHIDLLALSCNNGAYGRTLGALAARTEFVAFADDDSWWAPGALAAAADLLAAHPTVAAVVGRILVGPEERLDDVSAEMAESPLAPGPSGHPTLLGFVACATMVRRAAFLDVGGFDRIVRFPGEEERVALDLADLGHELIYADDVIVHHHPSPRRHDASARRRAVTRSAVLTALLRLPWNVVFARSAAAIRAGTASRLGVLDALRDTPRALPHRRRVSRRVLRDRALLSASSPGRAPAPPSK